MATPRNNIGLTSIRNLDLAAPHLFTLSDTKGNTFYGVTSVRQVDGDGNDEVELLIVNTYIESLTQYLLKADKLVLTHFDQAGKAILALEAVVSLSRVRYADNVSLTTNNPTTAAVLLEMRFELLSYLHLSTIR